jgi:ribosomal protein L37E
VGEGQGLGFKRFVGGVEWVRKFGQKGGDEMIKCPICGHENPDGAKYCEACGAWLVDKGVIVRHPFWAKKKWYILIGILVVGLGVGLGVGLTRGSGTAYATYSNYGFSIEYPSGMEIAEEGMFDPYPNDESGILMGLSEDEAFMVAWTWTDVAPIIPELEDAMDEGFLWMGWVVGVERGPFQYGTKSGHQTLYQSFTVSAYGETVHGIWGVWYCNYDQKVYQLMVICPDGMSQTLYNRYLDSFVCH